MERTTLDVWTRLLGRPQDTSRALEALVEHPGFRDASARASLEALLSIFRPIRAFETFHADGPSPLSEDSGGGTDDDASRAEGASDEASLEEEQLDVEGLDLEGPDDAWGDVHEPPEGRETSVHLRRLARGEGAP